MKIGTKSVLFGVHCWCIHPFMVWIAWIKLYSWTWSIPTITSFFLHDIGYIGKPNMDGKEGELHVELGAKIMHKLFDGWEKGYIEAVLKKEVDDILFKINTNSDFKFIKITSNDVRGFYDRRIWVYSRLYNWYNFTLYHSRFYAKNNNARYSALCVADKYAFCMYPKWLYMFLASLSGEIYEYMKLTGEGQKYSNSLISGINKDMWYRTCYNAQYNWVMQHRDIETAEDIKIKDIN